MSELELAQTKDIKIKEVDEAEEERKLLAARELGQAVKRRIKELRWVQQDLADSLITSQSVISSIIAGKYPLTFELITRVAKALKLSPMKLASYYWKEEEQELFEHHQEALERIRDLLTDYYQIGGHQQDKELELPSTATSQTPEANSQADIGLAQSKEINIERDITKKANPTPKKQPKPHHNQKDS